MYFAPEAEELLIEAQTTILAGSLTDPDEETGEAPKSDAEI